MCFFFFFFSKGGRNDMHIFEKCKTIFIFNCLIFFLSRCSITSKKKIKCFLFCFLCTLQRMLRKMIQDLFLDRMSNKVGVF